MTFFYANTMLRFISLNSKQILQLCVPLSSLWGLCSFYKREKDKERVFSCPVITFGTKNSQNTFRACGSGRGQRPEAVAAHWDVQAVMRLALAWRRCFSSNWALHSRRHLHNVEPSEASYSAAAFFSPECINAELRRTRRSSLSLKI